MKEENHGLYMLKGLGCIAVVFIHVTFPGHFGLLVKQVSAFAVPAFLMISGYYATSSYHTNTVSFSSPEYVKRRLKKTVVVFLYGFTVFFIIRLIEHVRKGQVLIWLSSLFSWKNVIKFFFFCTVDFAIPLWYLIAMCEVWLFWWIFAKREKENLTMKLIIPLLLVQLMLTIYCESTNKAWFWKINFATSALVWFLIGYWIRKKVEKVKKINSYICWSCVLGGLVVSMLPIILDTRIKFSSIGIIPYAIGIFILTIKYSEKSISKSLELFGKSLSLNVYILHVPLAIVIHFGITKITNVNAYQWIHPIITVCCSLFISYIIFFLKQLWTSKRLQDKLKTT